ANQYQAYDALSPTMQQLLSGLRGAFTGTMPDDDGVRREVVTYHPIVRTHPATGRRSLAIGRIESVPHIEGMTPEESRGLLQFLYAHAASPEFVYRHSWRDGDVVMWDNRCLLHYAVHDHGDATRLMHRVTVVDPDDERAAAS
ncbi:MAG TPA: TauD/TfdA family dioxygenase, partial [Ilumatobacteraceae bacterium]|nr:TauD/TfdA family dioxygenase [Ilumatobacteraceae bacterium]